MDKDTIFQILILTILTSEISESVSFCNDSYNATYGTYLPSNISKIIQPPIGRRMCISECLKYKQCQTVNHYTPVMGCQLVYDTVVAGEDNLVSGDGWTNIQIEKVSSVCTDKERLIKLHNGEIKCVVDKCDSVMTIDNEIYFINDSAIGTRLYLPCNSTDGYISVGCTYICKSTGNWEVIENKSWIKVSNTSANWYQARDACTDDNATMLIIPNRDFFNDLRDKVNSLVSNNQFQVECGVQFDFWIGASDIETEGYFKWANGDNFTDWQISKQNYDNVGCTETGTDADCALINTSDGAWNDRYCGTIIPFICQKPI